MAGFPIRVARIPAGTVNPKFTAKTPAAAIPFRRVRLERNSVTAGENAGKSPPNTSEMALASTAIAHETRASNPGTQGVTRDGTILTLATSGARIAAFASDET